MAVKAVSLRDGEPFARSWKACGIAKSTSLRAAMNRPCGCRQAPGPSTASLRLRAGHRTAIADTTPGSDCHGLSPRSGAIRRNRPITCIFTSTMGHRHSDQGSCPVPPVVWATPDLVQCGRLERRLRRGRNRRISTSSGSPTPSVAGHVLQRLRSPGFVRVPAPRPHLSRKGGVLQWAG